MSDYYHSWVHLIFIGIIALFPVVNPIGSAFILNPYFAGLTNAQKKMAVKKITLYAFFLCTISLFAGHWILALFGISIPVVQLAGGITICKLGWDFLSASSEPAGQNSKDNDGDSFSYESLQDKLFYPITFPITTGAGTLAVLFTLSAHSADDNITQYLLNTGALMLSIIVMCILVYIFYLNTKTLIQHMGASGQKIINRISAFLIFCVGLQIAVTGIRALMKM